MAIAIPAMNEEDRIISTLASIVEESLRFGGPVSVAVLANNCTDKTGLLAAQFAAASPIPIRVADVTLPPEKSNAGHARARAFDLALLQNADRENTILVSTDADTRPQPHWLSSIEACVRQGADAVAGSIEFEPDEVSSAWISPVRQLEANYACLQAEIIALTDPRPHDPWPNHVWVWGANFAITEQAYKKVGGVPTIPLAEDRALAAALDEHDCRVRHALDVRVWTSARKSGRASGGLADLIGIYESDDEYPCDAELEAAASVYYRASTKRHFRDLYTSGRFSKTFADALVLPHTVLENALGSQYAGRGWSLIERESANLRRTRIFPGQLAGECKAAAALIADLRGKSAAPRQPVEKVSGLWMQFAHSAQREHTGP